MELELEVTKMPHQTPMLKPNYKDNLMPMVVIYKQSSQHNKLLQLMLLLLMLLLKLPLQLMYPHPQML
jgi:hypothetical protein